MRRVGLVAGDLVRAGELRFAVALPACRVAAARFILLTPSCICCSVSAPVLCLFRAASRILRLGLCCLSRSRAASAASTSRLLSRERAGRQYLRWLLDGAASTACFVAHFSLGLPSVSFAARDFLADFALAGGAVDVFRGMSRTLSSIAWDRGGEAPVSLSQNHIK